jgi:hypothetical protein
MAAIYSNNTGALTFLYDSTLSSLQHKSERGQAEKIGSLLGHQTIPNKIYSITEQSVDGSLNELIKRTERLVNQLATKNNQANTLSKKKLAAEVRKGQQETAKIKSQIQAIKPFINFLTETLDERITNAQREIRELKARSGQILKRQGHVNSFINSLDPNRESVFAPLSKLIWGSPKENDLAEKAIKVVNEQPLASETLEKIDNLLSQITQLKDIISTTNEYLSNQYDMHNPTRCMHKDLEEATLFYEKSTVICEDLKRVQGDTLEIQSGRLNTIQSRIENGKIKEDDPAIIYERAAINTKWKAVNRRFMEVSAFLQTTKTFIEKTKLYTDKNPLNQKEEFNNSKSDIEEELINLLGKTTKLKEKTKTDTYNLTDISHKTDYFFWASPQLKQLEKEIALCEAKKTNKINKLTNEINAEKLFRASVLNSKERLECAATQIETVMKARASWVLPNDGNSAEDEPESDSESEIEDDLEQNFPSRFASRQNTPKQSIADADEGEESIQKPNEEVQQANNDMPQTRVTSAAAESHSVQEPEVSNPSSMENPKYSVIPGKLEIPQSDGQETLIEAAALESFSPSRATASTLVAPNATNILTTPLAAAIEASTSQPERQVMGEQVIKRVPRKKREQNPEFN